MLTTSIGIGGYTVDTHQIIVIGVAGIVPHNAMADSMMDDISLFVEDNTEAEILDEMREIRPRGNNDEIFNVLW